MAAEESLKKLEAFSAVQAALEHHVGGKVASCRLQSAFDKFFDLAKDEIGGVGESGTTQEVGDVEHHCWWVGVDIGGTTVSGSVVNDAGDVTCDEAVEIVDRSFEGVIELSVSLIHRLLESAGIRLSNVRGIGIGVPGLLDLKAGVVKTIATFSWRDAPLCAAIASALGDDSPRVVIENDANAAVLAEWWVGAGRGKGVEHMVMMTLGTGIGAGIICNGDVLRGFSDMAGELGHVIVENRNGRLSRGTGVRGVFEEYGSARAVAERAQEALAKEEEEEEGDAGEALRRFRQRFDGRQEVTAKEVFEAAANGDAFAGSLVDETARYLAIGCINICRILDPQLIVFTGGLAMAGDLLFDAIRAHFRELNWSIMEPTVEITGASAGNLAGTVGAAAAARLSLRRPSSHAGET